MTLMRRVGVELVDHRGHLLSHEQKLFFGADPVEFNNRLKFEGVSFVGANLSALDIVSERRWVRVATLEHFDHHSESLISVISEFLIRHLDMTSVLQDANDVRVRCILVLTIEVSVSKCLVLPRHVRLVHPHFDKLINVARQVRQWSKRLVEELGQYFVVVECLVLVALLDRHYVFVLVDNVGGSCG